MPHKTKNIRHMVLAGIFSAMMALCAWIAIPIPPVAFTLQTFAVFLALAVLGGRWGSVSIFLYLLLGLVGLPVFSGFQGSGALMGPTAGFLWGFLAAGLSFRLLERLGQIPAMAVSLAVCYGCGCRWFMAFSGSSWAVAFLTCVAPYLPFDIIKLWLAYTVGKRIKRAVKIA